MAQLHTFASAVVLALLANSGSAQGRNATLLSTFSASGESSYSDVWGYTAPNGDEYCLLLGRRGTYVVDCTNPSSPRQTGSIPGPTSGWRDARTWGTYAYVVTEGGGGMQIIDLTNPQSPSLVTTYTGGLNWSNTHNLAIDTQTGMAYPCGTSGGMHVLDITNPTSPTYVTSYTTDYVHDLHIQDGLAHLAEINRSTYRLVDVRNLPTIQSLGTSSFRSAHNAWPTRDNEYVVVTSETTRTSSSNVWIVDIRNRNNPTLVATYHAGGSSTSPHNAFIVDRVCHVSYYSEGYRTLDLSDPANPVEVGFWDTSGSTSGFTGNWGVYPFSPSGVMYVSDTSGGLFIVKPKSSSEAFGAGTAGTGGVAPDLHLFGAAFLGNGNFKLEVENAAPNSSALFMLSTARQTVTFGGLTLLVDVLTAPAILVTVPTGANGKAVLNVPVPNDNGLNGLVLHVQSFVQDPNGPLGISATAGKTFEVFPR